TEGDLVTRSLAGVVDRAHGDPDHAAGALVQQRSGDVHPLEDLGPGGPGMVGEDLVEVAPGAGEPEARERGGLRPGQLEAVPAAVDPQALVAHPAVLGAQRDTHRDELTDRPGGQAVTTDLVAGEGGLL